MVDRPFIFAIVEEGSDVPLFAGKIHDPTGAKKRLEVIFYNLDYSRKFEPFIFAQEARQRG